MLINADFSQPVIVEPGDYRWVASPQAGVERMMLDRIGEEKARATSIVRYAPASHFPPHRHPGGEEILVLAGTFSDETGDFPAGCYLRNPDGSGHQPSSAPGALIFVKLRQMAPEDDRSVRIDTRAPSNWRREGEMLVCPLFSSAAEEVRLQRLQAGQAARIGATGGAELLLLEGELAAGGRHVEAGTWMRLPPGDYRELVAGRQGACWYLKTGHLAHPVVQG